MKYHNEVPSLGLLLLSANLYTEDRGLYGLHTHRPTFNVGVQSPLGIWCGLNQAFAVAGSQPEGIRD